MFLATCVNTPIDDNVFQNSCFWIDVHTDWNVHRKQPLLVHGCRFERKISGCLATSLQKTFGFLVFIVKSLQEETNRETVWWPKTQIQRLKEQTKRKRVHLGKTEENKQNAF